MKPDPQSSDLQALRQLATRHPEWRISLTIHGVESILGITAGHTFAQRRVRRNLAKAIADLEREVGADESMRVAKGMGD